MSSSIPKMSPAKESLLQASTAEPPRRQVKVTLYIGAQTMKDFKKLAIDRELPYSELAELAFSQYLEEHQRG